MTDLADRLDTLVAAWEAVLPHEDHRYAASCYDAICVLCDERSDEAMRRIHRRRELAPALATTLAVCVRALERCHILPHAGDGCSVCAALARAAELEEKLG